MRRILFALAPLGLAAFSFACEDDSGSNPSANLPEAGAFDSNRPDFDSSRPDAQPDGPVAPKGVTVVATGRTGPVANITVLFHDATGAVTESKKTGADGKATSVPSPTPAMATVVFGESTFRRRLVTWTGVADGDELPAVVPSDVDLGTVEVTLAGQPDAGTFNYYSWVGDCQQYANAPSEPWTMNVSQNCARGGGALLVRAADFNENTVGFAFKKPITLVTDGGVAQVTTGGWVAPTKVTFSLTNTTDTTASAVFHQVANNTAFRSTGSFNDAAKSELESAGPTFADAYNGAVVFSGANGNFNARRIIGRRVASATNALTFDAAQLPPEVTATEIDATDKKRPTAKWSGTMTGMKGGVVRLFYLDSMSNGATTAWSIVVPATGNEVKAPALPASLESILPSAEAGQSVWDNTPTAAFADSNVLPDYAAFRKIGGVLFPTVDEDASFEDAVLPAAGDYKITGYRAVIGE